MSKQLSEVEAEVANSEVQKYLYRRQRLEANMRITAMIKPDASEGISILCRGCEVPHTKKDDQR